MIGGLKNYVARIISAAIIMRMLMMVKYRWNYRWNPLIVHFQGKNILKQSNSFFLFLINNIFFSSSIRSRRINLILDSENIYKENSIKEEILEESFYEAILPLNFSKFGTFTVYYQTFSLNDFNLVLNIWMPKNELAF